MTCGKSKAIKLRRSFSGQGHRDIKITEQKLDSTPRKFEQVYLLFAPERKCIRKAQADNCTSPTLTVMLLPNGKAAFR